MAGNIKKSTPIFLLIIASIILLSGCTTPTSIDNSINKPQEQISSFPSQATGPLPPSVMSSSETSALSPDNLPSQQAIAPAQSQSFSAPPSIIPPAIPEQVRVVRIIDGDTIDVDASGILYRVRYIGIDTPEYDYSRPEIASLAEKATSANAALVSGKIVRLEKDISETDKYGRLLRYVYVDTALVNGELLKLGWAEVFSCPPDVKYDGLFASLQSTAKSSGIGRWVTTATKTPDSGAPQVSNTPESPTPSTPNTELSLQITSITSPVKRGGSATLSAHSVPGANCVITVYYKSGPSKASGLNDKIANSAGDVSWTWTVGTNTTPGSWLIEVKATSNGKTVSQAIYFSVQQ